MDRVKPSWLVEGFYNSCSVLFILPRICICMLVNWSVFDSGATSNLRGHKLSCHI